MQGTFGYFPARDAFSDMQIPVLFKGYDGLLPGLAGQAPSVSPDDFLNHILWSGVVDDGSGITNLIDGVYLIVIQPTELGHENERGYLCVEIDHSYIKPIYGAPYSASSPFNFISLPGSNDVNMVNGNYIHSFIDLAVIGADTIAFTRTYNSLSKNNGVFGNGWSTSLDYKLDISTLFARVKLADGYVYNFKLNPDGSYEAPRGSDVTLEKAGGSFIFTSKTLDAYTFDSAGRITSIRQRNGSTITFIYSGNQVVELRGNNSSLIFNYNGSRLSSVSASPGNRTVSYTYNYNGNLESYTNPDGKIFSYSYDGIGHLSSFTDGNGDIRLEVNYDSSDRAISLMKPFLSMTATVIWRRKPMPTVM